MESCDEIIRSDPKSSRKSLTNADRNIRTRSGESRTKIESSTSGRKRKFTNVGEYYCFMATAITRGKLDIGVFHGSLINSEPIEDFSKSAEPNQEPISETITTTPENLNLDSLSQFPDKGTNRTLLEVSQNPMQSIVMLTEFGAAIRPDLHYRRGQSNKRDISGPPNKRHKPRNTKVPWGLAVVVEGFGANLDAASSFQEEWKKRTRGAIPRAGYSLHLAKEAGCRVYCDWEAVLGEQFPGGLSVESTESHINIAYTPPALSEIEWHNPNRQQKIQPP